MTAKNQNLDPRGLSEEAKTILKDLFRIGGCSTYNFLLGGIRKLDSWLSYDTEDKLLCDALFDLESLGAIQTNFEAKTARLLDAGRRLAADLIHEEENTPKIMIMETVEQLLVEQNDLLRDLLVVVRELPFRVEDQYHIKRSKPETEQQWTITRYDGGREVTRRYSTEECLEILNAALQHFFDWQRSQNIVEDVQLKDAWWLVKGIVKDARPDDFPKED